jgi:hypothetical protein
MPTKEDAKRMAEDNAEAEATIVRTYWFPDDSELRIIHVDEVTLPSEGQVHPFLFQSDPTHGLDYPSRIALIQPNEERQVKLPPEWGGWDGAVLVFDRTMAA